jgi:hypothetical protein
MPARYSGQIAAELGVDQHELQVHLDNMIRATLLEICDPVIPADDREAVPRREEKADRQEEVEEDVG